MAKIIWTEAALDDIDAIAEYISLNSVFYAEQFIEQFSLLLINYRNFRQ
jgi:plasmid stabilization system protein ParE